MKKQGLVISVPRLLLVLMMAAVTLGGTTGCKSKKKLAKEQAAAEYAQRVEQATKDLNAILNDETIWSLAEKEARLATIESWGLQDEEVLRLIPLVNDKLARERAEAARKAEEERIQREEEERIKAAATQYAPIENFFNAIIGSSNVNEANEQIEKALKLFATPDVPVLIIISQDGGFNDYDRPTTIRRYLEQLKDVRSYRNRVERVQYDANGKITELELIKK